MFLGQEKPFPPCCNHRVAQLSAGRSHPCPQIQHCAHPCSVTMCQGQWGCSTPSHQLPCLHPKNNLQAVKKPSSTTATALVGFFTARRLFLGMSLARGFGEKSVGMGMERGAPLLSPLGMQMLPAGTVSGLLAANRALAVLALADASSYNRELETSSRRMEQRRAEIRALG